MASRPPITLGLELEAYTIQLPELQIGRQMAFPRKGVAEKNERFGRDSSIGTEYNSQPFAEIREGLFLLKAGLRKYNRHRYRSRSISRKGREILLVGGWRDRYAGAHIHVATAGQELDRKAAKRLAWHLHDHIPLLIAVGANSPIWADEITEVASNRVLSASATYFRPVDRRTLTQRSYDEMLFNKGRARKPATLELRVLDSNLPELVMAAACLVKAVALRWRSRRRAPNVIDRSAYLTARRNAALSGMRSRLCWNGRWLPAPKVLDAFIWEYRDELRSMDIPDELWTVFRLLKLGFNGAEIVRRAAVASHAQHPQTWQRRFAKRYVTGLNGLLSGNDLYAFADALRVRLPEVELVWLGRPSFHPW